MKYWNTKHSRKLVNFSYAILFELENLYPSYVGDILLASKDGYNVTRLRYTLAFITIF